MFYGESRGATCEKACAQWGTIGLDKISWPTTKRPMHRFPQHVSRFVLAGICAIALSQIVNSQEFGFSKVDITPESPVRLSGYGSREVPSEGVDERLFVRAMAIQDAKARKRILVSVESIGFPGVLVQEIFGAVKRRHQLQREDLVVCFTHNHTAPHIANGLPNLFNSAIKQSDQARIDQYTERVKDLTIKAIDLAVSDIEPGKMFVAQGKVTFARNRRVLADGIWTGFGENARGPVDHSLPLIRVTDVSGETTRGLIFNYACHCTTFGAEYNKVNGDWAGYASKNLESETPDAIAICTIGCGADANPARDSKRAMELSKSQGKEISDEIKRLLASDMRPLRSSSISATYGFAGLPIDRPNDNDLDEAMTSARLQVRNHAQAMTEIKERMGRLPETYPMPIQVWNFRSEQKSKSNGKSNDFTMVFLGGEVCVDYATRIKKELFEKLETDKDSTQHVAPTVWISAYANDVFGYVAPERMQSEGGYEVDFSMIYYLQPGRWLSGTEDIILKRVNELVKTAALSIGFNRQPGIPSTIQTSDDLEVRLLASEPIIRDPINMCVDASGHLWVVEMGDYPGGDPAHIEPGTTFQNERAFRGTNKKPWDGAPGGRIKRLHDSDGDGTYDESTVFLDGLKFPTGVFPWKDGVLVCAAPDIFFAKDTDGDGKADVHETLYTGFSEANPQHRVNGFEWGLDGWLYLAAGNHSNGEITSVKTGEKVNTSGRDIRIEPHSGAVEAISGPSQWCRCRDDFGNWYGNDNTRPLYQFVIEERFLKRNPFVPSPTPFANLTTPAQSPPVFPTSVTDGRFNDLATKNRFTSACGPAINRNNRSKSNNVEALICEPVHNLISRLEIDQHGIEFRGQRTLSDSRSEFMSSTDNWFRPVRVLSAPNSDLVWVVDMYRQVIEHPEWIPESWQSSMDLYAGSEFGRIYALREKGNASTGGASIANLRKLDSLQLAKKLLAPNGWQRDTAQQLLLERHSDGADLTKAIEQISGLICNEQIDTRTRIQALWTISQIAPEQVKLKQLLRDRDADIVANTIRAFGLASLVDQNELTDQLGVHESPQVRFQFALALGQLPPENRGALKSLAADNVSDPWMRAAILSSSVGVADSVLVHVFEHASESPERRQLVDGLIATAMGDSPESGILKILKSLKIGPAKAKPWQLAASVSALDNLKRKGGSLAKLTVQSDADSSVIQSLTALIQSLAQQASDEETRKRLPLIAVHLIGHTPENLHNVTLSLTEMLGPQYATEYQSAAVESLGRIGHVEPLVAGLKDAGPALQARIQTLLLTRSDWTRLLMNGIEQGKLGVDDLSPSTREILSSHRDEMLQNRFAKLFTQTKVTERSEILDRYEPALQFATMTPDLTVGRKLFETNCAACHRFGGMGKSVGPDLAGLQSKTTEYILTAVLDPNRAVEAKYRAYNIITTEGSFYSGMILEESATSVKVALADGTEFAVLRAEIEEMVRSNKSFMPEGFEKTINPDQMKDLLAFIEESRNGK